MSKSKPKNQKKTTPTIKPLFMWAGGKNKLISKYLPHLPKNIKTYSEPFFGAGAMYLWVQENLKPEKCYINDINEGIIRIYRSIQQDPERFIEHLKQYDSIYMPLSKEERKKYFYKVRTEHAFEYSDWDQFKEAATLYFLMKTGFNGIWQINKNTNFRFGTPSGLLNQKTSVFDYQNILEWHKLLQNTEILCGDWSDCPSGDFTFIDPPYRDSFTNYGTGWGDKEAKNLIEVSRQTQGLVFLCNRDDNTGWIENHSQGYEVYKFPITYTAGRRKKLETGYEAKPAIEVLMVKN